MSRQCLMLLLLALLGGANAYPWRWTTGRFKGTCGKHPTSALGAHTGVSPDGKVKWAVKAGKKTVSTLCPGTSYQVTVSWQGAHHALLTTSSGAAWSGASKACPLSTWMPGAAGTSMTRTLKVSCTAKAPLSLKVTHTGPRLPFLWSSKRYRINTRCAAASCTRGRKLASVTSSSFLTALTKIPNTKSFYALAMTTGLLNKLPVATVLVPTDQAVAKLLRQLGNIPPALAVQNKAVTSLIKYHIINAAVPSSRLKDRKLITTSLGQKLRVRIAGKTIRFEGFSSKAKVVKANIKVGKGYIHLIDTVLIPAGLAAGR